MLGKQLKIVEFNKTFLQFFFYENRSALLLQTVLINLKWFLNRYEDKAKFFKLDFFKKSL